MSLSTSLNELCLIAYRLFCSLLKAGSRRAFVMIYWSDAIVMFACDILYI